MNISKINFELEGICPLKMDRWLDEPQPKNEKGYIEQAKLKVYTDENNNLCIPNNAIKATMRYASSEVGKKMESKKNRQTIKSAVFVEQENITLLDKKNKPIKTYDLIAKDIITRQGIGDKSTRVPTYRPLIKSWKAKGTILSYGVSFEFIKECLSLAGFRYGILAHRPEFGRFIVTKFEEENDGK
jgi:hypothetical protein